MNLDLKNMLPDDDGAWSRNRTGTVLLPLPGDFEFVIYHFGTVLAMRFADKTVTYVYAMFLLNAVVATKLRPIEYDAPCSTHGRWYSVGS